MKKHTASFKEEIKTLGKQQKVQLIYNNKILDDEIINMVTYHYEGDLLKSIMKGLEIDININIPLGSEIGLKYGLLVNGAYEYIDYGKYIVYEVEKQEDTGSYNIICYDKLLYSMKPYEKMNVSYPISIEDYLKTICSHLQIDYSDKNQNFVNYSKIIPTELYLDNLGTDLGYTFRDVLDEIAQATASVICINNDDELEVRYINDTGDTIDEEYLKDVNVNFGQKYGKINSIVLSRSAESDNVFISDEESIEQNGLCEIKIIDNQIMNFNNRDEFLPEMFNMLNGLEYCINDFSSTGVLYYDILDRYNVRIGENSYSCIMLNDEINITQGLEEVIYTNIPEISKTDYSKSDKTDRRINQTYLIVDKQNKKIEAVISETTKQNEKISKVTQTVEELNSKISDVADITTSDEKNIAKVILKDINECEPIRMVVRPIVDHISYLYPSNSLFPNDSLHIRTRIIEFKNTKTDEIVLYQIPDNLYYYDEENADEFILDYDAQTCIINKNVGIDENGKAYLLENPTTIEYEYPKILLTSGDYEVSIVGYNAGYLFVRLMATNIYTTQFATKAELSSEINQTTREINLSVDEKLKTYPTEQEMKSAINISAQNITTQVSKKVGKEEIIAQINVAVKDKQGVINLTGNQVTITSDKFKLTKEGEITATAGNIAGWTINNDYLGKGLAGIKGIGNTTSDSDVFYAGNGLGYNGDPAFHVTNKGNMSVKSLSIRGRTASDIGKIQIFNEKAMVGTTMAYDKVESYYLVAGNGGSTPTLGKCMHGYNMANDFRCSWDGSRLYFMVDDANIGYVTTNSSDVRLKKDITDIPEELMYVIEEIELKQFKLINGTGKYKFGIIAQDLVNAFEKYKLNYKEYEIISEVQLDLTDKTLYFTIDYEQVLILKNQLLENKVKALERKVDKILEKINIL